MLPLSRADLHHVVTVLRIHAGEEIDVVEPGGRAWRVRVEDATTEAVVASVAEELASDASAVGPTVTLVFGISKGSKNDDVVEGATEVGVSALVPVLVARSIVKLDAEKRAERGARFRRVAAAAAKQSKRASVPGVSDPAEFADVIASLSDYDLVLVAWEEAAAEGRGVRTALETSVLPGERARVAIVVGPEGGMTADEVAALERAGGVTVTLGATILRAETAAVVGAALVIHELGGLGNAR